MSKILTAPGGARIVGVLQVMPVMYPITAPTRDPATGEIVWDYSGEESKCYDEGAEFEGGVVKFQDAQGNEWLEADLVDGDEVAT